MEQKIMCAGFRALLLGISMLRLFPALVDFFVSKVLSLKQNPFHNDEPLSRLQGHGRIPSHPRFLFLYH